MSRTIVRCVKRQEAEERKQTTETDSGQSGYCSQIKTLTMTTVLGDGDYDHSVRDGKGRDGAQWRKMSLLSLLSLS